MSCIGQNRSDSMTLCPSYYSEPTHRFPESTRAFMQVRVCAGLDRVRNASGAARTLIMVAVSDGHSCLQRSRFQMVADPNTNVDLGVLHHDPSLNSIMRTPRESPCQNYGGRGTVQYAFQFRRVVCAACMCCQCVPLQMRTQLQNQFPH